MTLDKTLIRIVGLNYMPAAELKMCDLLAPRHKRKSQVNAVNKKAKGQNFENYEVYSFKCCGHHDQGQGVVLKIIVITKH